MIWITGLTVVFVAAAYATWKIARKFDELDFITRRKETQYARFQRLVKKYGLPGFVYATTRDGLRWGVVVENLYGDTVLEDRCVMWSDLNSSTQSMRSKIWGFMNELSLTVTPKSTDYI